jgi:hypothetical protein
MLKDFETLEKAFKKSGPEDSDVNKKHKQLVELAHNTKRDALEVQAKRQLVDSDLALTKDLLEKKIPEITAAANKQLKSLTGGFTKAAEMIGGADFDPKYLRNRLTALVANHPSEQLSVCDDILKGLRKFRLELNEADFKTVLADTRQRASAEQTTTIEKEKFEQAVKDFDKGDFAKARGSLLARGLDKVRIKKREGRVKTMETVFEQAKKTAKNGDYDSAMRQLEQAKKLAQQIIELPDGSKPPAAGDFEKLKKNWELAVGILQKDINALTGLIEKAAADIAANDSTRAKFKDDTGKKVVDAFKSLGEQFDLKAFDTAMQNLQSEDEEQQKAAKEATLQVMRKYRRVLVSDPLFARLKDNPFKGVNVKPVYVALDNIDLVVQTV